MITRTNIAKLACLGTLAAGTLCLAQQSVPTEKGSISGIVAGTDGRALRRATVRLIPISPAGVGLASYPGADTASQASLSDSVTETDEEGSFTFDDVAPSRYSLAAERSGYLSSYYESDRGPFLTLKSGQRTAGVVITMTPQGIIAGKVVDEDDEPLPGATVNIGLYAFPKDCAGCVLPGGSGTGTTDADGAFSIGGLSPGRYLVSVKVPAKITPAAKAIVGSRQEVYVTTYYPDATNSADATAVELAAGGQARSLEIKLQKPRFLRSAEK